ncbi:IS200/IS605 family transposase [Phnomibacter ginsenosidimutans]|uniref:IS200/IS605 family transposase n=1 Tax=Phnomibacter ginsenosidimutans TaxID=2676868 RepID=UPI0018D1F831|nr:IS200/IS605 family transposase [Phnomibacter ginsenosidimutans]
MPNTYTKIYIHVVFAVQGRQNLLQVQWRSQLYKYICGIVNGKKQKVYAIGGVADHIHILLSIKPDIALSDLIRDIKTSSAKWINDQKLIAGKFHWQEGFGAFSSTQISVGFNHSIHPSARKTSSKTVFQTRVSGVVAKI